MSKRPKPALAFRSDPLSKEANLAASFQTNRQGPGQQVQVSWPSLRPCPNSAGIPRARRWRGRPFRSLGGYGRIPAKDVALERRCEGPPIRSATDLVEASTDAHSPLEKK